MIGGNWVLDSLERVDQTVLKEVAYLVFGLIKDFLQRLQEGFDLLMSGGEPLFKQGNCLVLLLIFAFELFKCGFGEQSKTNNFVGN